MVNYDDGLIKIIKEALDKNDIIQISNIIQRRPDLLYKEVSPGVTLRSFIRSYSPDLLVRLNNSDSENIAINPLNISDQNQESDNKENSSKEGLFEDAIDLIRTNQIGELKKLLEEFSEILSVQDKNSGNTLAFEAVINGNIQALELISKKSKEEFDNKKFATNPLDIRNNEGDTPLIMVAKNFGVSQDRDLEMMQILLNSGASIDVKNNEGNNAGIVLLNNGIDVLKKFIELSINTDLHKHHPEEPRFLLSEFSSNTTDRFSNLQSNKWSRFYNDKNSSDLSLKDILGQMKLRESEPSIRIDDLIDFFTNMAVTQKPSTSIVPRSANSFNIEGKTNGR